MIEDEKTGTELPDVCVVTHPLGPAGENATRTLLEILSSITTVSLVTAYLPDDSTISDDYDVTEVTKQSAAQSTILFSAFRFVLNQFRMCRALYRKNEQVVLFFGATAYLLPIIWAKLLGRTVVLEPRGDVPLTLRLQWEERVPAPVARVLGGTVRLIERLGYQSADAIVTYTPSMAEELGLDRYEEKLYPDGARYVDTDRFSPQVPFDERDPVAGYLGRLSEEKGVRTLAAVAQCLPDDVTFRFIGDGELREWLETELADEIDAGRVELTGWVDHDDVPDELSALRLLVMPSQPTEGLPTSILEAMGCGTPVYATPVSGVPDVVKAGETGRLMTTDDPDQLAREIETLLRDDTVSHMGDRTRQVCETEFSFEESVARYDRILKAIRSGEAN